MPGQPAADYSGWIPAFFTSAAYFAISERKPACAYATLLVLMVLPCLAMVSLRAAALNAASTASCTRLTLAAPMPLGPMTANQASTR